jgi:hypothetical protein
VTVACAHCGEVFEEEGRLVCPHCGVDVDFTYGEEPAEHEFEGDESEPEGPKHGQGCAGAVFLVAGLLWALARAAE